MLKKENRLKKRKEFAYIYKNGSREYSTNLTMIKIKSKYQIPRIGISVSNKVGKAVVRNKIKRRLRAILGGYINSLKYCNIIFVAQPSITQLDYIQIKEEVFKLLQKGKLYESN